MTHGNPCFIMHGKGICMCDTWLAMCQHAWHMEKAIYGVWERFVEAGSSKKEKEGKNRREKERKERVEKKRERGEEREREKEKRKTVFQRSKLVRLRSKVRIFDEDCTPRGRDSSYLGFFLFFQLLFWSTFGSTLCHVYGMFCGINWYMIHLRSQLRRGCSRSKGLLSERIWVENFHVREFPKCSCNFWAHDFVDWHNSVAPIALQLRTTISFSFELRFTHSWTFWKNL